MEPPPKGIPVSEDPLIITLIHSGVGARFCTVAVKVWLPPLLARDSLCVQLSLPFTKTGIWEGDSVTETDKLEEWDTGWPPMVAVPVTVTV